MLPTRVRKASGPIWGSPIRSIEDEFDRVFGPWLPNGEIEWTGAYPVDIHEDKDHLYVEAELPGFTKEQTEVTFENGILSIVAKRETGEQKKGKTHLAERRCTRVARSFTLPNTIDENKIDAKLENGVLHLTLHKREEVKPRRISVN